MEEFGLEDLIEAQRNATEKALRLNRALGLRYLVIRGSDLVSVAPDGTPTVVGKPLFGTRKITRRHFKIKDQ